MFYGYFSAISDINEILSVLTSFWDRQFKLLPKRGCHPGTVGGGDRQAYH